LDRPIAIVTSPLPVGDDRQEEVEGHRLMAHSVEIPPVEELTVDDPVVLGPTHGGLVPMRPRRSHLRLYLTPPASVTRPPRSLAPPGSAVRSAFVSHRRGRSPAGGYVLILWGFPAGTAFVSQDVFRPAGPSGTRGGPPAKHGYSRNAPENSRGFSPATGFLGIASALTGILNRNRPSAVFLPGDRRERTFRRTNSFVESHSGDYRRKNKIVAGRIKSLIFGSGIK